MVCTFWLNHFMYALTECVNKCLFAEICPVDKVALTIVVSNLAVAEQINELFVHCRYGLRLCEETGIYEVDPTGCPDIIRLCCRR